jgi:hypothetical protein
MTSDRNCGCAANQNQNKVLAMRSNVHVGAKPQDAAGLPLVGTELVHPDLAGQIVGLLRHGQNIEPGGGNPPSGWNFPAAAPGEADTGSPVATLDLPYVDPSVPDQLKPMTPVEAFLFFYKRLITVQLTQAHSPSPNHASVVLNYKKNLALAVKALSPI